MKTLLRNVEIDGARTDVLIADGVIATVGPSLTTERDETIDGGGGAALPGLHDHHLHLLALAAARRSILCGPPDVRTPAELAAALTDASTTAGPGAWLRGVGYHESVAGSLTRHDLDGWLADRPVRIQHRGGALWMLNSRALQLIGLPDHPDGRLWRMDAELRAALPVEQPDLGDVGAELTALGITGVTDATPDLDQNDLDVLMRAASTSRFQANVILLGAPTDPGPLPAGCTVGPRKLLLHDHNLPDYPTLLARIRLAHESGRPVAVHCVTRESLLLTLTALEEVGVLPGDRIEHAAVVPHEVRAQMAALGVRVVTQPGFLRTRGDDYLREVAPDDLPLLYPWAGLTAAGVRVAPSSDAPFGDLDPWQVIADAAARTTESGYLLNGEEQVPVRTALDGYLSAAHDPGGSPRRLRIGAPADICLLHLPLREALASPHRDLVRQVWHAIS